MRIETALAVYDTLLSDERIALDALGFLEELLSNLEGGDGTVIIYARRLCRQAEDALEQEDVSTMLASLLSLRACLCNSDHEQFWRLHLGEDGRKALWSGQPAGGLHQLPSNPEDVLETIFCTAVTYQLTQDLGLENPDQLVHALEHHRYASESPQTSGALEQAMQTVCASVSVALREEPGATQAGDTIATLSWPFAIQAGHKQELLKESWRNQDALGMKIDSSWRAQGKSLVALIRARLPPPYLEQLQDLPKPQAFAAAHVGMCPPNAPTLPPRSISTIHDGEVGSLAPCAACAACTARAAQEAALQTAAPGTTAAAAATAAPSRPLPLSLQQQQQQQQENGHKSIGQPWQSHIREAHVGGVAPNASSGGVRSSGGPHGSGPSLSLRHALSPQREQQNALRTLEERRRQEHNMPPLPRGIKSAPPSVSASPPNTRGMSRDNLFANHACPASPAATRGMRTEMPPQQQPQQQRQQQQQACGLGVAAPAGSIRRGGTAVAEGPDQGTHGANGGGREMDISSEGEGGGETTMPAAAAGGVANIPQQGAGHGSAGGGAAMQDQSTGQGQQGGQALSASTRGVSRRGGGTKRAPEREEHGVAGVGAAATSQLQQQQQQGRQQEGGTGNGGRKRARRERGGVVEGATAGVMGGVVVGISGQEVGPFCAPEGEAGQESYSSSPHDALVPDGPGGRLVAENDKLRQMAEAGATLEEIQLTAAQAGSPAQRACTSPSRSAHAQRQGGVQGSPHIAPLGPLLSPAPDPFALTDNAAAAGAGQGGLHAANSNQQQQRRASGSGVSAGEGLGGIAAGVVGRECGGDGGGEEQTGGEVGWEDRPSRQIATGGGAQAEPSGRGLLQGNGGGAAEVAACAVGGRAVQAPVEGSRPPMLTGPGPRLGAGMYTTRQWGDSPEPEARPAQRGRSSRGADAEDQADEVEFTEMGAQDGQLAADAWQRALQLLPRPPYRRSKSGGAQERRVKKPWTRAEEVMLVKLMCRFKRRWAAILEEDRNLHYGARLLRDRDQVSLKDKFRNLEKGSNLTQEFLDWVKREDTVGDFKGQALKPRD